jgi:LysR family nod box-dependent transcriptional activator
VMREVPFDIPPIREAIQWHISNNNDRALRWVVERLAGFAQESGTGGDSKVVSIAEARRDEIAIQFQNYQPTPRGV